MEYGFCIIISKYRLYQGVALYFSLIKYMNSSRIFFLCMDDETYEILSKLSLENIILTHVREIENEFLLIKKRERQLNAYCWTLKPVFLEYVINKFNVINSVTYIDADIYFFNTPDIIFKEGTNYSVLLSKHNYTRGLKGCENLCGKYNSGFISFKRNKNGLSALKWWKDRCLEWCHDKAEYGKFGDQKYLDQIPSMFNSICEVQALGTNIGFWNHGRYKPSIKNGKVHINNVPLIFYHFAGLRLLSANEFAFTVSFKDEFAKNIYDPYIVILQNVITQIKRIAPDFNGYFTNREDVKGAKIYRLH